MGTKHRHEPNEAAEPEWVAALDAMLAAAGRETTHRPNLIEFAAATDLVTRVRVHGHGTKRSSGGPIEAVAEVTTALPESEVSPPGEVVELCNRIAMLSALVAGPAGGAARVCTRIAFPSGDATAARLDLGLLRAAALLQGPWLQRCMAWLEGRESDSGLALPGARDASKATAAQLKKAERRLDDLDVFCDADALHLTAEFTWPEGTGRALHAEASSRFRLDAAVGHPIFGAGLAHELELPEELGARAHNVASALNALELRTDDAVPMLGAWCRTLDGRGIAHVGFVPNAAYADGLAACLSEWALQRSRWARERILQLDVS
jgi:hypothetical protein